MAEQDDGRQIVGEFFPSHQVVRSFSRLTKGSASLEARAVPVGPSMRREMKLQTRDRETTECQNMEYRGDISGENKNGE